MGKAAQHVQSIGEDDIWETPPAVFEKFCRKVGIIPEVDVCATMSTTKCRSEEHTSELQSR